LDAKLLVRSKRIFRAGEQIGAERVVRSRETVSAAAAVVLEEPGWACSMRAAPAEDPWETQSVGH